MITKEKKAEYDHRYHSQRYARNKAVLTELKTRPCMDCKKTYAPWIMEFDHRDPLEKRCNLTANLNQVVFEEELAKCDIVCANCHRERTHKQRLNGTFLTPGDFNVIHKYR